MLRRGGSGWAGSFGGFYADRALRRGFGWVVGRWGQGELGVVEREGLRVEQWDSDDESCDGSLDGKGCGGRPAALRTNKMGGFQKRFLEHDGTSKWIDVPHPGEECGCGVRHRGRSEGSGEQSEECRAKSEGCGGGEGLGR